MCFLVNPCLQVLQKNLFGNLTLVFSLGLIEFGIDRLPMFGDSVAMFDDGTLAVPSKMLEIGVIGCIPVKFSIEGRVGRGFG